MRGDRTRAGASNECRQGTKRFNWTENTSYLTYDCLTQAIAKHQYDTNSNKQTCSLQLSDSVYSWEYYRTGKVFTESLPENIMSVNRWCQTRHTWIDGQYAILSLAGSQKFCQTIKSSCPPNRTHFLTEPVGQLLINQKTGVQRVQFPHHQIHCKSADKVTRQPGGRQAGLLFQDLTSG